MHNHGPSCLEGPVSGARSWWKRAAPVSSAAATPTQGIRADLVARVRSAIAAGTYDTPEKWEIALARLLQQLDAE